MSSGWIYHLHQVALLVLEAVVDEEEELMGQGRHQGRLPCGVIGVGVKVKGGVEVSDVRASGGELESAAVDGGGAWGVRAALRPDIEAASLANIM